MLAAQEEAVREDQALWSFSARCGWVSLKGFPVACGRRPSLGLPCLTEGACYSWALQAPRRALFWGCVSCPGLGWAGRGAPCLGTFRPSSSPALVRAAPVPEPLEGRCSEFREESSQHWRTPFSSLPSHKRSFLTPLMFWWKLHGPSAETRTKRQRPTTSVSQAPSYSRGEEATRGPAEKCPPSGAMKTRGMQAGLEPNPQRTQYSVACGKCGYLFPAVPGTSLGLCAGTFS